MKKLMIADSSEAFVSALTAALRDQYRIETCFDGRSAAKLLQSFQPDILILNLILPYEDGLTLLQKSTFHPHIILAITPYLSAYVQHSIQALGIDFTMICPAVDALCLRLQDLVDKYDTRPDSRDPLSVTVHHLKMLNLPPHLDGYKQLCAAIPLYAANPRQFLTKELYPEVAKQCGCRDGRLVEHSIRHAITTAWARLDRAVWRKYFAPGPRGHIPCPTNKEFICRLAELIDTR